MPPPKRKKNYRKTPSRQPAAEEPSVPGSSNCKQPTRPPVEQSAQAASRTEKPQVPASQQLPGKEQSAKGSSKGKQPMSPPSKQINSRNEKPQKPSSQQPSTDVSTQGPSKGKLPIRSLPGEPAKAGIPLDQSKQANPKTKQPDPEQQVRPDTKSKKPQEVAAKESIQAHSKGKQPVSKPVYGNPRFYMARIPLQMETRIKRVLVSVCPDTAFRHPQTHFFKNIPSLEPYWGYFNDKAFTAQRIIRLKTEEKPMPYFLMVCRGEYPKIESPRNDNDVFQGMYEPIFNDAFVFKLGDPELYPTGYARYVHIEENIGRIEWLPQAIRDAARKVECAMARDADPGFPDVNAYADAETMAKDLNRMVTWATAIRKANTKYESVVPIDETAKLPDLVRMGDVIRKWTRQVSSWKTDDALPLNLGPDSSDYKPVADFIEAVREALKAVMDACTIVELPETDPTDALQNATNYFLAARNAFLAVQTIAVAKLSEQVLGAPAVVETTEVFDLDKLKKSIDAMTMDFNVWKVLWFTGEDDGDFDLAIFDEFEEKARTVVRLMEEHRTPFEVLKAFREFKITYEAMGARVERQKALMTAKANKVDAA